MISSRKKGFTIVELLIVIVVIAILATISVVAYNGIQARANDASIKSAAAQLEKSIIIWSANSGQQPRVGINSTQAMTGGKCIDGDGGWVFKAAYLCTLEHILLDQQLVSSSFFYTLPPNKTYGNNSIYTFMFYPCGTNRFVLYYYLNNPTSEDAASLAAANSICPRTYVKDTYGMQAAKLISF